jgi:hypothetical protein
MVDRQVFFDRLRDEIRAFYLAEPEDPYRLPGRSTGPDRWELKRRCIADAVDEAGDFMDEGCANELLLESLRGWCDVELTPHGIDFVPELIEYAKQRHPDFAENFTIANVWDW